AIARQTERLLVRHHLQAPATAQGRVYYRTTGEKRVLQEAVHTLLGEDSPDVALIHWQDDVLHP
ncbi:MAG: hypothetical protein D6755_11720, partial [Anaerolineae bacterium]